MHLACVAHCCRVDSSLEYRDRSRLLSAIGIVLVLAGGAVAFLGPLETYCFYLFSEGGRFRYEGFGVGSLMFGIIADQVIGYPLIGAALIAVGCGHLMIRRWARTLALALLWSWLVVGVPLIVVAFFVLAGTKDLSPAGSMVVLVCLGLSYLVVPGLFIRFYRGRNSTRTFETRDPGPGGGRDLPIPILVLSCLYLFFIVALAMLLLFRGMFPLFGTFLFGPQGIVLLDVCMACLACLIIGTLRRHAWSWLGSVLFLGLLTLSTVLSFSMTSFPALISALSFPETEMAFLRRMPVQGWHLAIFAGLPLLATWSIAVVSKRYFRRLNPRDASRGST
jgi:hypothetical protein